MPIFFIAEVDTNKENMEENKGKVSSRFSKIQKLFNWGYQYSVTRLLRVHKAR
jgi:hypothetical protein